MNDSIGRKLVAFVFLLPFAVLPAARAAGEDPVPFADFGKTYLQTHGASAPADLPLDKLLHDHFVRVTIGLFDIAYPAAFLSEKKHAEEFAVVCKGLLDLQQRWISWLSGGDAATAPLAAEITELGAWIAAWKPPLLAKAAKGEDKSLLVGCEATEAQAKACESLTKALLDAKTLGVAPKDGKTIALVFAPTRRAFVELLGYAGLLDTAQQSTLWTDTATSWTSFWIGMTFVLALEYPPWAYDPTFQTGLSMNQFEETGLLEHTLQQAGNTLQWVCYGDSDALYLHQAVAMNLVISICGEINALEGDAGRGTTGAKTDPYEKFVPGGNSAGGVLPPIPAAPLNMMKGGHWRTGLGKDHFATPLRKGQKEGLKQLGKDKPDIPDASLARDKNAHFLLLSEDGAGKYIVSAPFLGKHSKEKPYPPADVLLDYREFFRAFKSGFYGWLQEKGAGDASGAKFEELLKKVASRDPSLTFEDLVQQVYGKPLSGKNGETDSLEWSYLEWLGKGK
jgi:hypothetical protein